MPERPVVAFGAFRLDFVEKVLYREGAPVPLTPKALDTLAVLVERHPRLVTRDEIFARVWPDTVVEDNNLAQHISLLRRVLADDFGATPVIETVPRRGYRFCAPVTVAAADTPASAVAADGDPFQADRPAPAESAPPSGALPAPVIHTAPVRHARLLAATGAAVLVLAGTSARWGVPSGAATTPRATAPAAAAHDPEAHLFYLSGRAALGQGWSDTANQARARADLERAVARDPDFAPAWAWLARAYSAQYRTAADGRQATLEAAARAAATAARLAPELPETLLANADMAFSRGDFDECRRLLEAGRAALAADATFWHLLGFIEQREGRWRASEAAFTRAFDLDGPATAEWLGVHFLHLRQYADARRVLAVAHASGRAAAVVPEAWTRFSERGDVGAARAVLETALRARTPPDARVLGLLAQFEWFDGRTERALELIGSMDASGAWLSPNYRFPAAVAAGDVLATSGRSLEARARYAEAIADLERRRAAAPDDPGLMAALGLALAGLGRAEDAVQYAERAAALVPRARSAAQGPLYLYLLARVHARLGHRAEAFAVLDEMFGAPGFYSEAWVQRDPSFADLRVDPDFPAHFATWAAQKGEVLLRPSDHADAR